MESSEPGGLNAQVDFDGDFPIEGAKEVATIMTRYVSRALRHWTATQAALTPAAGGRGKQSPLKAVGSKLQGLMQRNKQKNGEQKEKVAPLLPVLRLVIDEDRAGNEHIVARTPDASPSILI